ALAGQGQEMQDVFWYIKEAIDAYFAGTSFEATVRAACLIGTRGEIVEQPAASAIDDEMVTNRVDPENASLPRAENTQSAELLVDESLIESEVTNHSDGPHSQVTGTSELDIAELEELAPDDVELDDPLPFDKN
ncbi:MAG: hypothetical protein AAGC55_30275, partial [Myxococcota bacterium]